MVTNKVVCNQGEKCPFMGNYFTCHIDDDMITLCPYIGIDGNRLHECPANIIKQ